MNPRDDVEWYSNKRLSEDTIRLAGLAKKDGKKMASHQCQLRRGVVEAAAEALLSAKVALRRARTFDELQNTIRAALDAANVCGAGALYVYDTALRLGRAHSPRLRPTVVYLHAGTEKGAAELLNTRRKSHLKKFELPPELHSLSAESIEDFLCVCAEKLKRLNASRH